MEKTKKITEDYVSFETAKLLKEKGFYGECFSMYLTPKPHSGMGNPSEAKIAPHGRDGHYYDGYLYQCEAPTLQMAMKWLREVHNIHVVPKFDFYAGDYTGRIYDGRRESTVEKDDYIAIVGNSTYEQACEAAIKYCLENLI